MKILVTGATGKLGNKVVHSLLNIVAADSLAVSVRDPQKAHHLAHHGVDVRQGDFDKPETLEKAFSGVDKLLIISTDGDTESRIRQHINAVEAAKKAGVKFIAYTSIANADSSTLGLAKVHKTTEEAIKKTGIPYSFLRNNWYLVNETSGIQGALAGAPWMTAAGSGKVGWATHQDYADAAAIVLSEEGHDNTVYELSGPLLTQDELVEKLEVVLEKKVEVAHVDYKTYSDTMKGFGLSDFLVEFITSIQKGINEKMLEVETDDFENLLGRPLTPISQGLAEIVDQLD